MSEGPRILVISEDDDIGEPLAALLRRGGYRVGVRDGLSGLEDLDGAPPDSLVLDRDLPPGQYLQILERLERHRGIASFPLLILGRSDSPSLPEGWHEDVVRLLSRPPQTGELVANLEALRRLAFYRPYRDLVHSLSQPVMAIHALSRSIGRAPTPGEVDRQTIERLMHEAERLMTLMEDFQRTRRAAAG